MILEIEYFKGDVLLTGKNRNFAELKKQIQEIETLCDPESDNFTALLCRKYSWTVLDISVKSDYTYDRDLKRLSHNW